MKKQDKYEIAGMIEEISEGTTEELKDMLEAPEPKPAYSDAQIKQAILDIQVTPDGMEQLLLRLERRGVIRQEVIDALEIFARRRRW